MIIDFSVLHDLTHPMCEEMPHWPGDPRTRITSFSTVASDGYNLGQLTIGEHTGTHIGAPAHFHKAGQSVDKIPADRLVALAVCLNIEAKTRHDRDYLVTRQDLDEWEHHYGCIEDQSVVLVRTGWSRFWRTGDYFGFDANGMHFPGISVEAADFLIRQRHIIGLGIDSAGIDGGQSKNFGANRLLAEHQIYHLENLNLRALGVARLYIVIGALPIKGGSGSPCRVLGFSTE